MKVQVERGTMGNAGRLDLIQPSLHEAQAGLVVDARGVGCQIGALGDGVDSGKQRDGLVRHQVHDVAFALDADQFQCQETADGLGGGNHLRTRQADRGDDRRQIDAIQQGHKQEQSGQRGTEGPWGQIQAAHIGDVGNLRFDRRRALVVGAAGKTREALLTEQDSEGVDADGVAGGSEFALHVIDREIAFTHGYRQIPNEVAGGILIDEVSAEGFVLALHRGLGGKEEVFVRRSDYLIYSTGAHTQIVLQKQSTVNMFWSVEGRQITECKQEWHQLHTVGAMAQEGLLTDLTG